MKRGLDRVLGREQLEGETCQRCGRGYRTIWYVSTDLWERVVGGRYYFLCVSCFDALTDEVDVVLQWGATVIPPPDLAHRDDDPNCWCIPEVEFFETQKQGEYTQLIVHNDPKAKGGES
jgi:hypothetical protein